MKKTYCYLLALVLLGSLTTGCVSSMPFRDQLPQAAYEPKEKVLISVIDQRHRVQKGKPRDFIGVAHGSFGIPFDWSVKQVLNVAEGDKDRDLAAFLQHRLSSGLQQQGWQIQDVQLTQLPSEQEARALLQNQGADTLLMVELKEWYFSINLNWVSAFNFDTDANVHVFKQNEGKILEKNIAERDVIEERANQSPQNNILGAYRDQLRQLINDPQVRNTLARQ